MKNKNIYIAAGVVVIILIAFFASKSDVSAPSTENETSGPASGNTAKTGANSGTGSISAQTGTKILTTKTEAVSKYQEIEFIDERIIFPLKNYPDVKLTITQVAFGRGDAAVSTGCTGIPNANFSTYLYPGNGVCLGTGNVDGSPRGIVALRILVENKGNVGFGGNSDVLRLHYLRSDPKGTPLYKFAYPIMGLENYYINGYASKEIILSYLVPEDQLVFNFVANYKEPAVENKTLNVYDFSSNGLLIDFSKKDIKVIK